MGNFGKFKEIFGELRKEEGPRKAQKVQGKKERSGNLRKVEEFVRKLRKVKE